MTKTIIGIRTNTWTLMEEKLYYTLLQYFLPENIFIVVDESKENVNIPNHLNKVYWNLSFIQQEQLLNYNHFNMGIGWLCGDYFYYALRKQVQADFYWLIEPDVLFSFDSICTFFQAFETKTTDGIFTKIRTLPSSDYWYKSASLIHNHNQKGCSFPLSRLSGRAIDLCKKERQKLSNIYRQHNAFSFTDNPLKVHFPNDEVLVLNSLKREGFSVIDIAEVFPESLGYFGYHNWFSIPQQNILSIKDQIIHPARPLSRIKTDYVKKIIQAIEKEKSIDDHLITEDNIDALSAQIGLEISQYCKDYFSKRLNQQVYFYKLKSLMKSYIIKEFNFANIWIFNNKTLVFDINYQDKNLVFDFTIQQGNIYCEIFDRYGNNTAWLEQFAKFSLLTLNNSKRIVLFEESNFENIETNIQKIMDNFSHFIQKQTAIS